MQPIEYDVNVKTEKASIGSIWIKIGGVFLAWCLPPVFAIVIAVRWANISKPLRFAGLIVSFLIPPSIIWSELAKGTPHEALSQFATSWTVLLTYTVFSICYMKRRKIRASLALKMGAAFIYLLFLLATMACTVAYLMLH